VRRRPENGDSEAAALSLWTAIIMVTYGQKIGAIGAAESGTGIAAASINMIWIDVIHEP